MRQLSFSLWATRIMQSRRAGNGIHTLVFLPEAIARAVQARTGQAPPLLLAMSEKTCCMPTVTSTIKPVCHIVARGCGRTPPWLAGKAAGRIMR